MCGQKGVNMRITKRQLRRIIREEKQKLIAENKVRHIVRRRLLEEDEKPSKEKLEKMIAQKRENIESLESYGMMADADRERDSIEPLLKALKAAG
jgi:hypothetical protein